MTTWTVELRHREGQTDTQAMPHFVDFPFASEQEARAFLKALSAVAYTGPLTLSLVKRERPEAHYGEYQLRA